MDPATQYARDVVALKLPASRLVLLACQRHLDDLARAEDEEDEGFPFYWDREAVRVHVAFFGLLRHMKGEWAGMPLELQPWQQFIIGSLFGWKRRSDGARRFRESYAEIPKKNGKSTMAAGVALLLAFFDKEHGAEVYCAATKKDQARIVFNDARNIVLKTPGLRRHVTVLKNNLYSDRLNAKLEPLGADTDTMDGLNVHGAVIDELHAHKSSAVLDTMETSTTSRRQPLVFIITTAGKEVESVCFKVRDYAAKLLERTVRDETFFAYVAGADPTDDWRKPETWRKANPNYGVSVKEDDLRRKVTKAVSIPTARVAFLRYHLNRWGGDEGEWLSLETWDAAPAPRTLDELRGQECYAGLDLGSTSDLCALVLLFPAPAGFFDVLPFFWCPKDGLSKRAQEHRVNYDEWVERGLVVATPGPVTDYDFIREQIKTLRSLYVVKELPHDRWNATQIASNLIDDGAPVVEFGQGFASMSAPVKELERLITSGKLRHGGNPVLRWMFTNVSIATDAAGNKKFDKKRARDKIDGMVALAMGMGRAIVHRPKENKPDSAYKNRGLRVF